MGLTFAPGLPPLILSLRMSNTGILEAYSTVLADFIIGYHRTSGLE
jgi:hypothetical protein